MAQSGHYSARRDLNDERASAPRRDIAVSADRIGTARFYILIVFLFLCLFGGGSARADVASLLYLRPAAIICIAALLLAPGTWDVRPFRPLIGLLALFALSMAIQLVPLPPGLWLSMPGRQAFGEAATAAGLDQPWRPISLTPDLTLNSLLALLPAAAMLTGLAGLTPTQRFALLPVVLIGIGISAILAIGQLAGGPTSPLYFYRVSHVGNAVGVFANRNHEGALLAMAFPLLRLWTLMPARSPNHARGRMWTAIALAGLLAPLVLVTGSRGGLILGLAGIVSAVCIAPFRGAAGGRRGDRRRILLIVGGAITALLLVGLVALTMGRGEAIERIVAFTSHYDDEQRLQYTPQVLQIMRDFFPFGSGFGSFDPVFRVYEADWMLSPFFYNHAHNDAIELVLTGGLAAALVFAGLLAWLLRRGVACFLPYDTTSRAALFGRAGLVMALLLLLASILDYPLRTPLLGVVFTLACGWLAAARAVRTATRVAEAG